MSNELIVHKARTNRVILQLGIDVSADTFTSEIRTAVDRQAQKIAEWEASFVTDGTDGEVLFVLSSTVTGAIRQKEGFMDVKRVTGGEEVSVWSDPLPVIFKEVVTV